MKEAEAAPRDDRTKVVILTSHYRVIGEIALMTGARLTDYVNDSKNFIAVINAEVKDHENIRVFNAPFLDVNREHVELIAPFAGLTEILP